MKALQHAIQEFIQSQRIDRGASEKTVQAYQGDLAKFARFTGDQDLATIDGLTLERFLTALSKEGLSASSLARKISALRQFFKFCCLEKLIAHNPGESLESPTLPQKL